jgi:hypothetical protein
MNILVRLVLRASNISTAFPRATIFVFVLMAVAGFSVMPHIRISPEVFKVEEDSKSPIVLTHENYQLFGEQDSLILVLELPEPPGDSRLPFIEGLGKAVEGFPGVRDVTYRFLNPDDEEEIQRLFRHFFLGLNDRERRQIRERFTPAGVQAALSRNRNRLFLTSHPYMQERILEDPLELGLLIGTTFKKRVGRVSFGDKYLFLASPDSTMFLIPITPSFHSSDVISSTAFLRQFRGMIAERIQYLKKAVPGADDEFKDLRWYLTGKTVFYNETQQVFRRDLFLTLIMSLTLVTLFLLYVYRNPLSVGVLMLPVVTAVGCNYGFIFLFFDGVNPVVMGSVGVLFGLGTDFAVHLWGRLRENLDSGAKHDVALHETLTGAGPAVVMGATTSAVAFACLCLAELPTMIQFGIVATSGVLFALPATLFLVPALTTLLAQRNTDYIPRMKVRFSFAATLFLRRPKLIAVSIPIIILVCAALAGRLHYERDLFKVFIARGLPSMEVAERVSEKFQTNFAQPTLLSFEVEDPNAGLEYQRCLDRLLQHLMWSEGLISTFDSISFLTAPLRVQEKNLTLSKQILQQWEELDAAFNVGLKDSGLAEWAKEKMKTSFRSTKEALESLRTVSPAGSLDLATQFERSWYQAKIRDKHRFLTKVRYASTIINPEELRQADEQLMETLESLPIDVRMSGPRQSMAAILSGLVSELIRLGIYAAVAVVVLLLLVFRTPSAVALSLVPMVGALSLTLGVLGAVGLGIPYSIIGVAPLIFGLGIDNGIHLVMRYREASVETIKVTVAHMTPLVITTSMTTICGFASSVISSLYGLQFIGISLMIAMAGAMAFTLVALPAVLLLVYESPDDDSYKVLPRWRRLFRRN